MPPRLMSTAELADYLGRSDTWLREHMPELEAKGLPRRLPVFGSYDRRAVDLWLDRFGGLETASDEGEAEAWMRAAGG